MNTVTNDEFDMLVHEIRQRGLSTDQIETRLEEIREANATAAELMKRKKWSKVWQKLNFAGKIKAWWKHQREHRKLKKSICRIKKLQGYMSDILGSHRRYTCDESKRIIELLGLCGEATMHDSSIKSVGSLIGNPTEPFYLREGYTRKVKGKYSVDLAGVATSKLLNMSKEQMAAERAKMQYPKAHEVACCMDKMQDVDKLLDEILLPPDARSKEAVSKATKKGRGSKKQ